MKFWKWYFRGILKTPKFAISAVGEYLFGIILAVASSMVIATIFSPLWLLLTIPIGATMAIHGFWRWTNKDKLKKED